MKSIIDGAKTILVGIALMFAGLFDPEPIRLPKGNDADRIRGYWKRVGDYMRDVGLRD